jgi:hypothetical protein
MESEDGYYPQDQRDHVQNRTSSRGKTRSSVGPGMAGGGRALGPGMEKGVGGRGTGTPK